MEVKKKMKTNTLHYRTFSKNILPHSTSLDRIIRAIDFQILVKYTHIKAECITIAMQNTHWDDINRQSLLVTDYLILTFHLLIKQLSNYVAIDY